MVDIHLGRKLGCSSNRDTQLFGGPLKHGVVQLSAVLIFHTALTNDVSPRQTNDFGWMRKTADEWPEPEVERLLRRNNEAD